MNKESNFCEKEKRHRERGYDYIERSEWDKAIREFGNILDISPNDIWAHIELGKLYRNKLEFDSAEGEFRKVLNMPLNNEQAERVRIGLGGVYRMLGEYDLAMSEFKEALKINPYNKKLQMWMEKTDEVFGFRKQVSPYRVFFTWGMHYECNYRCSYCHAPKPEKPLFDQDKKNRALYLDAQDWFEIWHDIYKKYGKCRIRLDGGEPSIYPSFTKLIKELSQIHLLQINTNLSFNVEDFVSKVKSDSVRIDASFHPEFVSLQEFLGKISILKKYRFKIVVSCVGYPPFLEKMQEYKKPFENLNIPFIILPFYGELNGKVYPDNFKKEEVSEIYKVDETSKTVLSWKKQEGKSRKGRLCRMGQIYGRIYPNGDVYRCCANGGTLNLGNIYKRTFRLLDEPLYCNNDDCPCWKSMIVGEEERWSSLWLDDWELPSA